MQANRRELLRKVGTGAAIGSIGTIGLSKPSKAEGGRPFIRLVEIEITHSPKPKPGVPLSHSDSIKPYQIDEKNKVITISEYGTNTLDLDKDLLKDKPHFMALNNQLPNVLPNEINIESDSMPLSSGKSVPVKGSVSLPRIKVDMNKDGASTIERGKKQDAVNEGLAKEVELPSITANIKSGEPNYEKIIKDTPKGPKEMTVNVQNEYVKKDIVPKLKVMNHGKMAVEFEGV